MAINHSEYALHLEDAEGNKVVVLPGDDLPKWAKITNPYVLGGDHADEDDEADGDGPPPRSGKGSGIRAWRKYASDNGIDADDLTEVEDVVAALEAEGVPVQ